MKKLLAILLSALMLCTVVPFATVSAAEEITEPTIWVSTLEANAGDEIEVEVKLLNNPGVIGATVEILYDESVMELLTYYDEDEEMDMNMIEVASGWSSKYITFGPLGKCIVSFIRGTATTAVTKEDFFTATFKIKDDAISGTYPLTVSYIPNNFFTLGLEKVPFDVVDGAVTINGVEPPAGCEHEYTYACDKVCALCGELTNEAAEHSVKHVDAVDATCYENGNIEYWYCEYCGSAWADEALTQVTNLMSVVVPMAHAEATHVEAVEPTCYENGNIEYWYCADCGQAWLDEACTLNTNLMAVVLPMAHAEATHVEAVAPTCYENGNIEYWYCADCGQAWLDEACTLNTNLMAVVLPMAHGTIAHVEAVDPTCYENGNIEYWYCEACGQAWLDEACTLNTNLLAVVLPMGHGTITHVAAKDATCAELGNIEYWFCEACGAAWLDEACTLNTNLMAVKLPMIDHEYFYACDPVCMNCYEITNPDAAHSLSHVEAVEATCYENGNIEYWTCEYCGGCWDNEAATGMPLNRMMVIVPAAHAEATHVEAVAPTCYENGNIEYWYCADCGQAWLDEACTLNTNLLAVVLPMAHAEATHVEALEPTCTALGNIEFWYCADCGAAWLDEACTLNTNMMAVKLPMVDHTYDNAHDADCNVCGEVRDVVLGAEDIVLFGGSSVSEIRNGLAFKFDAAVGGLTADEECVADYANAIVTIGGVEYKLISMGAIANNQGLNGLELDAVDNIKVLNIVAEKIFNVEDAAADFAIRIVNIPEAHLDTVIIARPYYVYENAEGTQITVYGEDVAQSYNGALN